MRDRVRAALTRTEGWVVDGSYSVVTRGVVRLRSPADARRRIDRVRA